MQSGVPQRGSIWEVVGQPETALGLLVVSNNTSNRVRREVTGVPVLMDSLDDRPTVAMELRYAATGELRRLPTAQLVREVVVPSSETLEPVWEAIADLLLLPELSSETPRWPPAGPAGDYPKWGRIYHAEPPLGGQTKRWLVVSHDLHNQATGRVVCVRTTSNTSLETFESPCIQRGFALAVAPDVQVKGADAFDLESGDSLEQADRDEMVVVARALTNFLALLPQTGMV